MKASGLNKAVRVWIGTGFCLGSLVLAAPARSAPPNLEKLENTPLPRIEVPDIQKATLPNGMRLLLLKDDATPVVQGTIYIRTGSIYESPDQLGLADVTGELLRQGGTKLNPPEAFNEALAALGAEVDSQIEREYGRVTFQCLSEDLPKVLKLVFEMLQQPAFDEERLQLIKIQYAERLRRENDQPDDIARREFPKLIYGRDNPWARTPTVKDISAITRSGVEGFYRRFYFPDRMIMALAGDFSEKAVTKEILKLTRHWPGASTPLPPVDSLQKTWNRGVFQVNKNTDQATIVMGHFGDKRFNPDKFALLLLNDILGGDALSSRLGKQIRSTLGLAYGVFSNFGLQTDYGIFYVFAQTKSESARQVIREIQKILKEIASGKTLTQTELDEHKQSVVNSLYSQYEPRALFAMEEARLEYLGYPPNYLKIFRDKILEVTLGDLRRVAQNYLKPEALQTLVVGDLGKIGHIPGAKTIPLEKN